ncbi:hypothetical protein RRG08_032988 [Elysia crispata]|uniref:Uncharacterized protein n=1 Tax=Elysia crispata TaxID=231223 RepID=A0AAE1D4E6_9GAST|nr:hypothetical protein RRG08_032988 [Elysia crispata]
MVETKYIDLQKITLAQVRLLTSKLLSCLQRCFSQLVYRKFPESVTAVKSEVHHNSVARGCASGQKNSLFATRPRKSSNKSRGEGGFRLNKYVYALESGVHSSAAFHEI